jgi:hypothetical protein
MSLRLAKQLALGAAVLANGAQLAAAGSGLPQRITTANDSFLASVADVRSGIAIDPDGLHVWVTARAANEIRKVRISDVVTVATITNNSSDGGTRNVLTPESLTRRGQYIWVAGAGAGNFLWRIDTATLVARAYAQAVGTAATVAAPYHVLSPDGTSTCWARTGNTGAGTYTEFTLAGTGDAATATTTARTQASMWDAVCDNAGAYMFFTSGTSVTRLTLATSATSTLSNLGTSSGLPGYGGTWRGLAWNTVSDKLIIWNNNSHDWWRVDSGFTTVEARVFGYADFGGPSLASSSTGYHRAPVAWSNDGHLIAFLVPPAGATASNLNNARVARIGDQSATWTESAATFAYRVRRIGVPQKSGSSRGLVGNMPNAPAFLAALYDWVRIEWAYSVNGGGWVTFDPSDDINVLVDVGETFALRALLRQPIEYLAVPAPYIGSDNGIGPTLEYERALPALGGLTC